MNKNSCRQVVKVESGEILIEQARWCDSYFSKLRAFTFRRKLKPGEALVLVDSKDSRVNSGITMFLCFLELGIIWVNGDGKVVDTTIARPWRPSYISQAPARFTIEADPTILQRVKAGDHLDFLDIPSNSTKKGEAFPPDDLSY